MPIFRVFSLGLRSGIAEGNLSEHHVLGIAVSWQGPHVCLPTAAEAQ